MRNKEEILQDSSRLSSGGIEKFMLEVLIDIRDILNKK